MPFREMTHVCLFTDSLEPSGVGEHMLTLAEQLRRDYRVSFVCPPSPGGDRLLSRAAALGLDALPLVVNRPDLRAPLRRWLRDNRIEVFHGHAGIGWEGHDGVYAACEAGVPAIVRTEHLPYLITDPWQRDEQRKIVERVDRLIAVSEEACWTFAEAGLPRHKLRWVRNGIHHRPASETPSSIRAELGLPADAPLALTIGRFCEQKGHAYLADAVPAVRVAVPDAHFLWAGSGPLEGALRAQICEAGLESHVHLLGQRGDVPQLLAEATLFVLPSLFEGLPLIVLEAMAAGLPVVATRVCGTAETVCDGHTGRLVPARDSNALADAIINAFTHPQQARQWGAAGRRLFVREFTAARMARETAAIYEELLGAAAEQEAGRLFDADPLWDGELSEEFAEGEKVH